MVLNELMYVPDLKSFTKIIELQLNEFSNMGWFDTNEKVTPKRKGY